jgi:hypothetical protein
MKAAVKAFREAGISVWVWHYVYGGVAMDKNSQVISTKGPTPEAEAEFAKRHVQELGADGYVIDAEREYKTVSQHLRARRFMAALAGIGVPVGLAGWRFPKLHPEYPWAEFLEGTDYHMPQVYWNQPSIWRPRFGPEAELRTSVTDLLALKQIPIAPAGRAYIGDGHPNPRPEEITKFLETAAELGCPGVSFWALDFVYGHPGGKERGEAIAQFKWAGPPAASPRPPVSQTETGGQARYRVIWLAMRARKAPGMDAATIRWLKRGDVVTALQVRDLGAVGTWAEIEPGEWTAISWKGNKYMERV